MSIDLNRMPEQYRFILFQAARNSGNKDKIDSKKEFESAKKNAETLFDDDLDKMAEFLDFLNKAYASKANINEIKSDGTNYLKTKAEVNKLIDKYNITEESANFYFKKSNGTEIGMHYRKINNWKDRIVQIVYEALLKNPKAIIEELMEDFTPKANMYHGIHNYELLHDSSKTKYEEFADYYDANKKSYEEFDMNKSQAAQQYEEWLKRNAENINKELEVMEKQLDRKLAPAEKAFLKQNSFMQFCSGRAYLENYCTQKGGDVNKIIEGLRAIANGRDDLIMNISVFRRTSDALDYSSQQADILFDSELSEQEQQEKLAGLAKEYQYDNAQFIEYLEELVKVGDSLVRNIDTIKTRDLVKLNDMKNKVLSGKIQHAEYFSFLINLKKEIQAREAVFSQKQPAKLSKNELIIMEKAARELYAKDKAAFKKLKMSKKQVFLEYKFYILRNKSVLSKIPENMQEQGIAGKFKNYAGGLYYLHKYCSENNLDFELIKNSMRMDSEGNDEVIEEIGCMQELLLDTQKEMAIANASKNGEVFDPDEVFDDDQLSEEKMKINEEKIEKIVSANKYNGKLFNDYIAKRIGSLASKIRSVGNATEAEMAELEKLKIAAKEGNAKDKEKYFRYAFILINRKPDETTQKIDKDTKEILGGMSLDEKKAMVENNPDLAEKLLFFFSERILGADFAAVLDSVIEEAFDRQKTLNKEDEVLSKDERDVIKFFNKFNFSPRVIQILLKHLHNNVVRNILAESRKEVEKLEKKYSEKKEKLNKQNKKEYYKKLEENYIKKIDQIKEYLIERLKKVLQESPELKNELDKAKNQLVNNTVAAK